MAKFGKQESVVEEKSSEDYGNAENILTVRHRKKNIFPEMLPELNYPFCMGWRVEPAASAGKCKALFVAAVRASYPGEPLI